MGYIKWGVGSKDYVLEGLLAPRTSLYSWKGGMKSRVLLSKFLLQLFKLEVWSLMEKKNYGSEDKIPRRRERKTGRSDSDTKRD